MNDTKTRMLKNMRRTVIFSILAFVLSLAGMINAVGGRQQQIDKLALDGEKCYIDVQLLYGSFNGEDGKSNYYIALDSKLEFYVVRLGNSDVKRCRGIIEYVESGGNGAVPETVRIAGVVRGFDSETRVKAIHAYNELLGRPVVNEGNMAVHLGSGYLDAASYIDVAWYVNFVPSIVCVIFAAVFLIKHYKIMKSSDSII